MAREDIIVMEKRELRRLHVVGKILDKELRQIEAAGGSEDKRPAGKKDSKEGTGGRR